MYSISSFYLAKLNNAEFVAYCVNLDQAITRQEAAQLGLETATTTQYSTIKQKLIDQVYTTNGSQYTAAMKTADAKRDKLVKKVFLHFQSICLEEQGSTVYPLRVKLETNILSKYSANMTTMPQHEESAVIQGFLHDVQTVFDEDDLDDMGVSSLLSNLEIANGEFISAYNDRSDERAAGDTGLTVKLRTQMLDIISQIYFTVQFYANSSLEANATKATACQAFIASVNIILADVKKRYNQRTGGEEVTDANGGNAAGGNAADGGNTNPAGGNDTPANGNDTPAGGNDTPANGTDNPSGGNSNPAGGNDTPAGGNSQPDGGPDPTVTDENAEF